MAVFDVTTPHTASPLEISYSGKYSYNSYYGEIIREEVLETFYFEIASLRKVGFYLAKGQIPPANGSVFSKTDKKTCLTKLSIRSKCVLTNFLIGKVPFTVYRLRCL